MPDAPVLIDTPPTTASAVQRSGHYVGVLVLYIDEQGKVRRIDAELPVLPPDMERAAREAFQQARFTPGQMDGHAVKSRIRVEVEFDEGVLPVPVVPVASAASAASQNKR